MIESKFKIGDTVIYQDVLGEVVAINPVFTNEFMLLSLVDVDNEENTCTANENECVLFNAM